METLEGRLLLAGGTPEFAWLPVSAAPLADVDQYQSTIIEPGLLEVEIEAPQGVNPDARLTLYGPSGQLLTRSDTAASADSAPQIKQHVSAGTYRLEVSGWTDTFGAQSYAIVTDWQPATGPFFKLPPGAAFVGELDVGWAVDEFEIWVAESGCLTVQTDALEGDDLENILTLWGPDDQLLTHGYDPLLGRSSSRIEQCLSPGVYRLKVSSFPFAVGDSMTGEYSLTTDWQPAIGPFRRPPSYWESGGSLDRPPTAGPILKVPTDTKVVGSMDGSREIDAFEITVTEPGRLMAQSDADAGSSLDSFLGLYGPNGELLIQSDDRSSDDFGARIDQHLVPGTYYLQMSTSPFAEQTSATGQYMLSMDWQAVTPPFEAVPVEAQPWAITSGYFNDDPYLDLATTNAWSNDVSILLGLGDGMFREQDRKYQVGTSPGSIAAGDFNGDGSVDLAVANAGADNVSFLLGCGDGTFEVAPYTIAVGDEPTLMTVSDLDRDDLDDLIVPCKGGGIWVLFGATDASRRLDTQRVQHISPQIPREAVGLEEDLEKLNVKGSFRSVAVGDLNGDRYLDLAVTYKRYDCVVTWLGSQGGVFDRGQVVPVGDNLIPDVGGIDDGTHVGVLDHFNDDNGDGFLNGEDFLDLATCNDTSNSVSVRFGLGDGTFGVKGDEYTAGDDAEFMLKADFNEDGYMDLATGNEDSRDVVILINRGSSREDGTSTFFEPASVSVGCIPDELTAGDFDGDGRTDLAVASRDDRVVILLGLGDGTFQQDGRIGVGDDPEALVYEDFNGDGLEDLATANGRSHDVSVLLGRGDGTFRPELRFDVGEMPHAIVTYDFNRDGRPDLATANERSNSVSILLGLGDGRFWLAEKNLPVGNSPWSLVAGDFDNDGRGDLATANRITNDVSVLYGHGDGSFEQPSHLDVGDFPELIIAHDFDADGHMDLGTVNRLSQDTSVLYGLSNREFFHQRAGDFPDRPFDASLVPGWIAGSLAEKNIELPDDVRFFPRALVAGDFNNDTFLDVAVADDRANEISVFLGYGNGNYQPALRLPTVNDPEWVAKGDFDSDGNLDLVTAHDHGMKVSIMLGLGNGAFHEKETYDLISGSEMVVVGDFNHDGNLDLACSAGKKLSVLIGKGDGTFETPIPYGGGTASAAMAVGDFDDRPGLDLVSAHNNKTDSGTLVVLSGGGDGAFEDLMQEMTEYPGEAEVKSLASADLNGDENLDLVAPDLASHRLFVFWGSGDAEFELEELQLGARPISSPWDYSVRPVVIADFNHDGHSDLVTVNEFDGEVSVVLNNGDGTFQAEQTFDAGKGPGALAAGYVNRDDHLDLIVGNRHSFDLSILLGNGDGTFQPETRITGGQEPPPSLQLDLNGDDRPDEVIVDDNSNQLLVQLNVGQGEHIDSQQVSAEIRSAPIPADFNGDGSPDSVQVNLWGDIVVHWGRPNEPGTFDSAQVVSQGDPARDVAVLSTDGGIRLAAVHVGREGGRITQYRFDQEQQRFIQTQTITDGGLPTKIAAADLNGDRWEDLVVVGAAEQGIFVFLANAQGNFSSPSFVPLGRVPGEIALIDVGSSGGGPDGWIDIVLANAISGDVGILLNDGQGRFAPDRGLRLRASGAAFGVRRNKGGSLTVRSRAQTAAVASGDFDGDGTLDLVLTNQGLNRFSVLFGKPCGGFVDPRMFPAGSGPADVHAAQLNDDNSDGIVDDADLLDIAVLNETDATISVFLNDGAGGFREQPARVEAGHLPVGLTVDDVNQDGKLDLLVGNEFGDLLMLPGNGDGSFRSFREGSGRVAMAAGDVNGDGQEDAVVVKDSSEDDRFLTVWWAQGQAFDDRPSISRGSADGLAAPRDVDVLDLNGDGYRDIIIANSGADNILVYLGNESGGFADPQEFPAGTLPVTMTTAQLNDDNQDRRIDERDLPDLLVASQLSSSVSVWFGGQVGADGNVLLLPGPQVPLWTAAGESTIVGLRPISIEAAYYDDDTLIDLIVSNAASENTFVFPGRGLGFFAEPIPFDSGPTLLESAGQILVGEFDGKDGNDLVVVDPDSDSLWMYDSSFRSSPPGELRPFFQEKVYLDNLPEFSSVGALAADFNGDETLDLFFLNDDRTVSVLSLDGEGYCPLWTSSTLFDQAPADWTLISSRSPLTVDSWSAAAGNDRLYNPFSTATLRADATFCSTAPDLSLQSTYRRSTHVFIGVGAETYTPFFASVSIWDDPLPPGLWIGGSSPTKPESQTRDPAGREYVHRSPDDETEGIESPWVGSFPPPPGQGDPLPGRPGGRGTNAPQEEKPEPGFRSLLQPAKEARKRLKELYERLEKLSPPVFGPGLPAPGPLPKPPSPVPKPVGDKDPLGKADIPGNTGSDDAQTAAEQVNPGAGEEDGEQVSSETQDEAVSSVERLWSQVVKAAAISPTNCIDWVMARWETTQDGDQRSYPVAWSLKGGATAAVGAIGAYFLFHALRKDDDKIPAETVSQFGQNGGGRGGRSGGDGSTGPEIPNGPDTLSEDLTMDVQAKDCLPRGSWEVIGCVDRFEAVRKDGPPDLRELVTQVSPELQTAAITELAAVDMEYRWEAGQPKTVEQYLEEYPEILVDGRYPEELIAQEYQVRRERGEDPPLDEYRGRFPDLDVERIISQLDTCTFTIGSDTEEMERRPAEPHPETIGRYAVREQIGSGAFGRVYRCYDARLKRDVAIKLLHVGRAPSEEQLKQFLHEARSAARLRHPGIVTVLDAGELEGGRRYIVYEYVPGQTLRERIRTGSYTREQAVNWCIEIARSLHCAHKHQVVHRDVSPSNVLLDRQGHVRLADFGLSKVDDQFFKDDSGRVLGSLAYISPEQAGGESHWASPQSDIYSLGVILYEMLARRHPFGLHRPRDVREILEQIKRRVPDTPRTIDDTIPEELEQVCLKAMAKNRAERYSTAADMAAALRAAVAPKPVSRRGRRAFTLGLLTAAAFSLAFGIWNAGPVTAPIEEPRLGLLVYRPKLGAPIDVLSQHADWLLPLRDGDLIHVQADLATEGYVYLFGCFADGRVELIWPGSLEEQASVSHFKYRDPPNRDWLKITSEPNYGTEMLLVAVSDKPLNEECIEEFTKVPFRPRPELVRHCRAHIVQVPVPTSAEVRGFAPVSEPELAFGKPFVENLEKFFRAYRGVVYTHGEL